MWKTFLHPFSAVENFFVEIPLLSSKDVEK